MTEIYPIKPLRLLCVLWLATLFIFHDFPSLDIRISALFFASSACSSESAQAVCGLFPVATSPFFETVRKVLFYLPALLAIFILASLLIPNLDARFTWPEGSRRNRKIMLAVWIVDVGLIVNGLLKAYSGRPRPGDTLLFGGALPFVPAGDFSGTCTSNCSFISGEAASAGWIFCLLALLPAPWRRKLFVPVTIISAFTALLRVAFGRHFFSDALLGWLSAVCIFALAAVAFGWRTEEIAT
jgi:lipid A 4'-phosphatase